MCKTEHNAESIYLISCQSSFIINLENIIHLNDITRLITQRGWCCRFRSDVHVCAHACVLTDLNLNSPHTSVNQKDPELSPINQTHAHLLMYDALRWISYISFLCCVYVCRCEATPQGAFLYQCLCGYSSL